MFTGLHLQSTFHAKNIKKINNKGVSIFSMKVFNDDNHVLQQINYVQQQQNINF